MWKGKIKPAVSDALVSQIDFTASFAHMLQQKNTTKDSENILAALLGKSQKGREHIILGQVGNTAFRSGDWILIPPHKGRKIVNKWVNIETGKDTIYQLYNLKNDPAQKNNLAQKHPEKLAELLKSLKAAQL